MTEKRPMIGIAGIAEQKLDEDRLRDFLGFYDYINDLKLGTRKVINRFEIRWTITYTGKKIAAFHLNGDSWSVSFFHLFKAKRWFDYCEKYLTDEMKGFILANMNTSAGCCVKKRCQSVENVTLLGKYFNERVCGCSPFSINNPSGKTLLYAKELTTICRDAFVDMDRSGIV